MNSTRKHTQLRRYVIAFNTISNRVTSKQEETNRKIKPKRKYSILDFFPFFFFLSSIIVSIVYVLGIISISIHF